VLRYITQLLHNKETPSLDTYVVMNAI